MGGDTLPGCVTIVRLPSRPTTVLHDYFGVLVFLVVGAVVGTALLVLGFVLGPRHPDSVKGAAYECGFEAFEDARIPFDVRYYLVAILFIIFDLEIAFFFPWAVALRELGPGAYASMAVFFAVLVLGFAYEWHRGGLEWE
jgi:NADH-quinone oxidoreductase subunit A